jgi:predicted Zn-dependent protease
MNTEKYTQFEKSQLLIAKGFSESNDYNGEIQILESLIRKNSKSAWLRAKLANASKLNNDYVKAEKYFKIAVDMAPSKELFSIGLFHCYWEQTKYKQAMNELARYTRNNQSDEYDGIYKELSIKGYLESSPESWKF